MAFAAVNAARDEQGELTMSGNRSLRGLAFVAAVFLLDWGQPFFVPLVLSVVIATALSPVVSALTTVVRWRALAAALVVLALIGLAGGAAYSLGDDVQSLLEDVPAAGKRAS